MQNVKDKPIESVHETVPPFVATCRAEPVTGVQGYSRCLVDANVSCGYRTSPFMLDRFCLHPRHKEIVARTAAK